MADLLGPSGQPLPPSNPLLSQQQGISSTASVNTGSAEKAFAHLQKVLDDLMKSFGGNWDKITNDRLKAEERFYRAVGDKAKERQVMLQRYSKEAIDSIEEEKRASLESLSMQGVAKEEFEKRKTEITRKADQDRANIEKETNKKLSQDRGIGGMIRGTTSFVGGTIGGSVGGLVTGIGELIANPATAIPAAIFGSLLEMGNTAAAFNTTGSQLSGAGFKLGTGGATGIDFATQLFGGPFGRLGQALSQDQQRDIIAQMSGSRTMIDQARGRGGFDAVRGNLGLFANILPDASKEMALFTDATKNLGMSQKDITNTFVSSRVNAERLKITQLDAISAQMDMQKALRNITNDGVVAASVLNTVGGFFHDIGKNETETTRMTMGVAQAGANLSLPQLAGMLSFTQGLNSSGAGMEQALFGTNGVGGMMGKGGSGVFGLLGGFLSKIGGQFQNPMQRLFAADALNKQLGLGIQTQDMPQFFNLANRMMTGNMNQKDFAKEFLGMEGKTPQIAMADGITRLASIVGPIQRLENIFTNFWTAVDERINRMLSLFHMPSLGNIIPLNKWVDKNVMHRPSGQSGTTGYKKG